MTKHLPLALALFGSPACATSAPPPVTPPPAAPTTASPPSVVGTWLAVGEDTTITFKPIDATDKLEVKWQPAPNPSSILVYPSGGGAHECVDFVLSEGYPHASTTGGAFTCAGDHKPTLGYTRK